MLISFSDTFDPFALKLGWNSCIYLQQLHRINIYFIQWWFQFENFSIHKDFLTYKNAKLSIFHKGWSEKWKESKDEISSIVMIQYLIVIQRIPFSTLFPQLIYPFQYASMKNDDEMKISYSFIETMWKFFLTNLRGSEKR